MILRYSATISVKNVWDEIMSIIGGVYDEKKPNEYQTFDYDTIHRSTITKIIEGFGTERRHKETGNVMIFDTDKLAFTILIIDTDKLIISNFEIVDDGQTLPNDTFNRWPCKLSAAS